MRERTKFIGMLLGMILTPILITMAVMILTLGLMSMPSILPMLLSRGSRTGLEVQLYTGVIGNTILLVGTLLVVGIAISLNVLWLRMFLKDGGAGFNIWVYFLVSLFLMSLPLMMIVEEEVSTVLSNYTSDLEAYKKGELETYYGPLQLGEVKTMDWPYYDELPENIQWWRGEHTPHKIGEKEEEIYFKSDLSLKAEVVPEAGETYKVTYLPTMNWICEVEKMDRWSEDNLVVGTDLLKQLVLTDKNKLVAKVLQTPYWKENEKILWEMIQDTEGYKTEYVTLPTDDSSFSVYLLVIKKQPNTIKSIVIIKVEEGCFEVYKLPKSIGYEKMTIDVMQSKTYGMPDLKATLKTTGEVALLRYDGEQRYKAEMKENK